MWLLMLSVVDTVVPFTRYVPDRVSVRLQVHAHLPSNEQTKLLTVDWDRHPLSNAVESFPDKQFAGAVSSIEALPFTFSCHVPDASNRNEGQAIQRPCGAAADGCGHRLT